MSKESFEWTWGNIAKKKEKKKLLQYLEIEVTQIWKSRMNDCDDTNQRKWLSISNDLYCTFFLKPLIDETITLFRQLCINNNFNNEKIFAR